VLKDFTWRQLVLTDTKTGRAIAGLKSVAYATLPVDAAEGTDVVDILVVEFASDATFFKDTAYILDPATAKTSGYGDPLYVAGSLKEKLEITDTVIRPTYCLLEFVDRGTGNDPTLRHAYAQYVNPEFNAITGLSGAPVYNRRDNALCGMVVRGGMSDGSASIMYFDVFDMMHLLAGALDGRPSTRYRKRLTLLE